jgi:hypothetical protein
MMATTTRFSAHYSIAARFLTEAIETPTLKRFIHAEGQAHLAISDSFTQIEWDAAHSLLATIQTAKLQALR